MSTEPDKKLDNFQSSNQENDSGENCSKKGACSKHSKEDLVKMKRGDIIKLIENDAKEQGVEVPPELYKLVGKDKEARKKKIKKISIFVAIGVVGIILLVLLFSPVGIGMLPAMLPLIIAAPGAVAAFAGFKKFKGVRENKNKLIDHLMNMNEESPEYKNIENIGKSIFGSMLHMQDPANNMNPSNVLDSMIKMVKTNEETGGSGTKTTQIVGSLMKSLNAVEN